MMHAALLLGHFSSNPTLIRLLIIVCTAIPEFSMHNEFSSLFEANALAGPNVDQPDPSTHIIRKKIASPKLSQPANTQMSILSPLLVTNSPPMPLQRIGQRSAPG
jgi:hypothetical protein